MDNLELELVCGTNLDLATTQLNYARFTLLAQNKNLSAHERIGFPDSYRIGFEDAISADICRKLDSFSKRGGSILDIGCGASPLTDKLISIFSAADLRIFLVDSPEMLSHIKEENNINKIAGCFPKNLSLINEICSEGYDYIVCYSVLHYIFVDANIFDFVDSVISLLKPGGSALIGDIPNISKRKRLFSSVTGKNFHKQFMQTTEEPNVDFFKVEFNQIDDSVLAGLIQRAQRFGCDAYLLPQASNLPMHNRRDDLLIRKP